MASQTNSMVSRLRQPKYTGENRCTPCTVLNTLIAVGLSVGIWIVSVEVAVAAFVLFISAIYFRGYLVPGTPELTQRYLPDRVLRLFHDDQPATTLPPSSQEIGAVLDETGIITECKDIEDVCLEEGFQATWREHIESIRSDSSARDELLDYLVVDRSEVTFKQLGANFELRVNGSPLGQWESDAALLADVAAMAALSDSYDQWSAIDDSLSLDAAKALRVFLNQCPHCSGPVSTSREEIEFCCEDDVESYAKLVCRDCGVRLLEIEINMLS